MFLNLNLQQRLYVLLALWLIGAFAMGIHLAMLYSGIPHPNSGGNKTNLADVMIYLLHVLKYGFLTAQMLVMLWLSVKIKNCFNTISSTKIFLLLFCIFCATDELFIRLPLTAGYVADKKFAFLWLYNYAPLIIEIFFISILVFAYASLRKYCYSKTTQNWIETLTGCCKQTGSKIIDVLFVLFVLILFMVIKTYLMEYLMTGGYGVGALIDYLIQQQYLVPPNKENVLQMPYPWQVVAIAMATFIEPIIAFFVIGLILYQSGYKSYWKLCLMMLWVILLLSMHLRNFSKTMIVSKFDVLMRALSIFQFTLEYVFIAVALPFVIFYIKKQKYL